MTVSSDFLARKDDFARISKTAGNESQIERAICPLMNDQLRARKC